MRTENEKLIIEEDLHDENLEDFIKESNQVSIKVIEVENVILGSLVVQALFVLSKEKKIIFKDPIMEKFFENILFE